MITRLSNRTPTTLPTATDVPVLKPPLPVAELFAVVLVPLIGGIGRSGVTEIGGVTGLPPEELVGEPGSLNGGGADDEGTEGGGDGTVDLGGGELSEGGD